MKVGDFFPQTKIRHDLYSSTFNSGVIPTNNMGSTNICILPDALLQTQSCIKVYCISTKSKKFK